MTEIFKRTAISLHHQHVIFLWHCHWHVWGSMCPEPTQSEYFEYCTFSQEVCTSFAVEVLLLPQGELALE